MRETLQTMALLKTLLDINAQLTEWNDLFNCLQTNESHNYLKHQLNAIKSSIESKQKYFKELQTKNEVLQYEITQLHHESSSITAKQPKYENIQRIKNVIQLKLLNLSSPSTNSNTHHLIGQIIKKKALSQIAFLELLISPHYLIKIALKKCDFSQSKYHEILTKHCKMGAIIECFGEMEDENAEKLVLILHDIKLIAAFNAKGFEPYKEVNKRKSAQILCSHFIKHFVSCSDISDVPRLQRVIRSEFVPKICQKSKCFYRHRVQTKNESNKIVKEYQLRQERMREEFDENDPYKEKQSKVARARLFGEWMIEHYGLNKLQKRGVLDIAGGAGNLSNVLAESAISVTIVDPRSPRKLNKNNKTTKHIKDWFDWQSMTQNEEIRQCLEECEVVSGLHPDQATEAIVDVSIKYNKKFAILPCCVFPNEYKKYMNGKQVVTYLEFVEYLKLKHPNIRTDYLPFKGRNKILYFDSI